MTSEDITKRVKTALESFLERLNLSGKLNLEPFTLLALSWYRRGVLKRDLEERVLDLIGDSLVLFKVMRPLLDSLNGLQSEGQRSLTVVDVGTGIGVPGIPLGLALEGEGVRGRLILVDRSARPLKVLAGVIRDLREKGYLREMRALPVQLDIRELRESNLLPSSGKVWLARAVAKPPEIFHLIWEVADKGDLFLWQYSRDWRRYEGEVSGRWEILEPFEYSLAGFKGRAVVPLVRR